MLSTKFLILFGVGFVTLETIKDTIKLITIPIVPMPSGVIPNK